jgi:hypothetical protein
MLQSTEEVLKKKIHRNWQHMEFLWIVPLLPLRYSLAFICPVSCVSYVASFYGFSFLVPLRYSVTFYCPVSCVP